MVKISGEKVKNAKSLQTDRQIGRRWTDVMRIDHSLKQYELQYLRVC